MSTPQEIAEAIAYNKKFSELNPSIPYDARKEPIGYREYLRTILRNQEAKGGTQYKDPAQHISPVVEPTTPTTPTISPSTEGDDINVKLNMILEEIKVLSVKVEALSTAQQ